MAPAPSQLNMRVLRALPALVQHGTVSGAATAIGFSQPALTQGLAKLERQLEERLFERRPGGLAATPAGEAMAERAARAFDHLAAAGRGARGVRGFSRPEQLMTATQLDAFLRVADAGSFVGAAAAGGPSQPAIHRAVRELEQLVGVPLLERRGRGVALTLPGRRMGRGVRLARREIEAGLAELCAEPAGGGRIVVGAMPLCRARVLPRALAAFFRERPGVSVEVIEGSWRELAGPLRDGVLDLTIGALRETAPAGLEQRALFADRLSVIARAGHPLAGAPRPTLAELASYPWATGSAETPLLAQFQRLFEGRPTPPAPLACGSVLVIRGLLCETDFLTLLSPDQVALEISSGVLTTIGPPLAGSVREIGLTTRAGWRPTAAQRRLADLVAASVSSAPLQQIE